MTTKERIHLNKKDCLIMLEALKAYNQTVDRKTAYDLKCSVENLINRIYQHIIKLNRSEKVEY